MPRMIVVYLSSPYTLGDQAVNVSRQLDMADRLITMGFCPYTPLLSHFQHIHKPRPYKDWMAIDLEILSRCDAVLRLPGKSKGADKEVRLALKLKIPVFYSLNNVCIWRRDTKEKRKIINNI